MDTIMKVNNLGKAFDSVWVLKHISFELKEDEIVSVLGPSGVGKTTLLRMLAGLETLTEGSIQFLQPKDPERDLISLVFEDPALVPWLTVYENIMLALDHLHLDEREKIARAKFYLDLVGLSGYEDSYPVELPKGLKKKASFARALSVEPVILLLDEPFSNIDALSAQALKDELVKITEDDDYPTEGTVFTTHSVEDAVYLSDKVIILDGKPGMVKEVINISLKRPRNIKSRSFNKYVDRIYEIMLR